MAEKRKDITGRMVPVSGGLPAPRQLMPVHRSQNQVLAALGNFFYELGFSAQYVLTRTGRIARDVGLLTWQALSILGRWLFRLLRDSLVGLGSDLVAPFRHFYQRRRQLARVQRRQGGAKGMFARARASTVAGLFANIIATYILPIAAVIVLVFTVFSVVGMQYALAVEYNGRPLGFVTDQSVVEGAKNLLRDRIRLAEDQELADWQLNPTYTIARADSFTTTSQMADAILLAGGAGEGDIMPATGFYMGENDLKAVTNEGQALKDYLDGLLEEQNRLLRARGEEGEVAFVGDARCDPESDEIFFASSVQSFEELMETLTSIQEPEQRFTADGEMTLSDIAVEHDLGLETLLIRNPALGEEVDGELVPEAGTDLLIERAKPFLQVQTTVTESRTEPIPYAIKERENDARPRGVRQVIQRGADGEQLVYDSVIYVDGEIDRRERQEDKTEILVPMVEEIVEVGTRAPQDYRGDLSAPGFIFPVPGTTYSTRGYSPGGHRGLDINAPLGSPIYASEAGTVVNAGWHYSFGNYVEISHANGINTLYAHCSALYVSAGQYVDKGTHIGAVGSTGNSSGNHCHLEVTVGGALTNPVAYVGHPY